MITIPFALLCILIPSSIISGLPHFNLFNAYDVLLFPTPRPYAKQQLTFAYERWIKGYGFTDDEDEEELDIEKRRVNPLQLWQCQQDALAAFKGCDFDTLVGQESQFVNIDDDNGSHGRFIPCGDFDINNIMAMWRYYVCSNISVGFFLPYIDMKLKNVCWRELKDDTFYETIIDPEILIRLQETTGLYLGPWHRHGFGDLAFEFQWWNYYPQARPILNAVYASFRGGLTIPTGKKADPDIILGVPFGFDGNVGVIFAGTFELTFINHAQFGVDLEFHKVFGNTRCRRIKVDPAQTDFMFPAKTSVFEEFGIIQHYTVWLNWRNLYENLSARFAYQFTSQDNNELYLCTDHFAVTTANSAISLREWSTHHFVFSLSYEFWYGCENEHYLSPSLMVFAKKSLNGRNAIVGDTVGATLSIAF